MVRKIIYIDNFLTGHGQTPTTGTTLVKKFRAEGLNVVSASSKQNKVLRLADMISTILKNSRDSVVLIATYSTSAFYFACACAFICQKAGVPYVPCLHGGNLPDRYSKSPKLSKSLFRQSAINIAVSGYLQQAMESNGWKSIVIPNSIDLALYQFKQRSIIAPNLLWVRSFHKIYNPTLAIRVVYRLR